MLCRSLLVAFTLLMAVPASAVGAEPKKPPEEAADLPTFSVIPMGIQGRFGQPSAARTNTKGTVVGYVSSKVGDDIRSEAFIRFKGGDLKLLELLPGQDPKMHSTSVTDVNDDDWAVGEIRFEVGRMIGRDIARPAITASAVAWVPGKGPIDLGVLPGDDRSTARAINNRNQVIGTSSGSRNSRAFLWESGKGLKDLGNLPNGVGTVSANGISQQGHVVGGVNVRPNASHPYLWTPEKGIQDLGELPGGTEEGTGMAVNDADHVVGYCQTDAGHRAFLWTKAKGMVELGSLPNWPTSIAYGINNAEWVVGTCRGPRFGGRGGEGGPFLWTPTLGLRDINDLLDPASKKVWKLGGAGRVNDLGEIEASGVNLIEQTSYRVRLIPKVPPALPPA
jgi:probable HAF family extracellular repeat protein